MNFRASTMKQAIFPDWSQSFFHFPDVFSPLRHWCNQVEIKNAQTAHLICRLIPSQCPFARTICLFGHKIITIPPLCKLNPLYDEFIALRFRALSYLVDQWGEDVSQYC